MRFSAAGLPGAFVIEPEPAPDDRGFFARQWCARELAGHGLVGTLAQASLSYNRARGTLRGMHYTAAPHAETKLVHCCRGSIHDVLLDLRPGPSYCKWVAFELSAANRRMLYVPAGVAHGFVTLDDDSEIQYFISEFFDAAAARGVRYNDPAFGITWPIAPTMIAPRDASYPDFAAAGASV